MVLFIDYGAGYDLREIRDVRVEGRYLCGDLFIAGIYFDYIELRMD